MSTNNLVDTWSIHDQYIGEKSVKCWLSIDRLLIEYLLSNCPYVRNVTSKTNTRLTHIMAKVLTLSQCIGQVSVDAQPIHG